MSQTVYRIFPESPQTGKEVGGEKRDRVAIKKQKVAYFNML